VNVERCRKFAYLLTALIVFSSPVMVCALPGLALSEAEKECCRHMAGMCGSSQMEESHTCCTKVPSATMGTSHPTSKYSAVLQDCVANQVAEPTFTLKPLASAATITRFARCESPPGHISILRI
jgi:hypothetical protein